jgi:hypothetical protein
VVKVVVVGSLMIVFGLPYVELSDDESCGCNLFRFCNPSIAIEHELVYMLLIGTLCVGTTGRTKR